MLSSRKISKFFCPSRGGLFFCRQKQGRNAPKCVAFRAFSRCGAFATGKALKGRGDGNRSAHLYTLTAGGPPFLQIVMKVLWRPVQTRPDSQRRKPRFAKQREDLEAC